MAFKLTIGFNLQKFGWSESYYTTLADRAGAIAASLDLVGKRMKFEPYDVELQFMRLSDPNVPRSSYLIPLAALGLGSPVRGGYLPNTVASAYPDVGIQWGFDDVTGFTTRKPLRTAPAGTGEGGLRKLIPGPYVAQSAAFATAIANAANQWCNRRLNPNTFSSPISQMIEDGANTRVFTVAETQVAVADLVRITGACTTAEDAQINGYWTVLAVSSPNSFTLFPPIGDLVKYVQGTGNIRPVTYVTAQINLAYPIQTTDRDTGRPFGLTVGRSPKGSCKGRFHRAGRPLIT